MQIDGDLREFGDVSGEFTERFLGFGEDFGDHEGGEDTVAGRFAWQNDVTRLFAAECNVLVIHGGFDVGVADWGDFDIDALFLGPFEKTLISHNSGSDGVEFEVFG